MRPPERGKVGGARPNSSPDPVLGPGNVRDKIKTVRLTPAEEQAQLAAAKRAGAKDWGTWVRDLANAAAAPNGAKALWRAIAEAAALTMADLLPAAQNGRIRRQAMRIADRAVEAMSMKTPRTWVGSPGRRTVDEACWRCMLPKAQHDGATLECPPPSPQPELLATMQETGVTAIEYETDPDIEPAE